MPLAGPRLVQAHVRIDKLRRFQREHALPVRHDASTAAALAPGRRRYAGSRIITSCGTRESLGDFLAPSCLFRDAVCPADYELRPKVGWEQPPHANTSLMEYDIVPCHIGNLKQDY